MLQNDALCARLQILVQRFRIVQIDRFECTQIVGSHRHDLVSVRAPKCSLKIITLEQRGAYHRNVC